MNPYALLRNLGAFFGAPAPKRPDQWRGVVRGSKVHQYAREILRKQRSRYPMPVPPSQQMRANERRRMRERWSAL